MDARELAELDYCYVITTGRRSGSPHTIEIWFGLHGGRIYLLSGDGARADWVQNIKADPTVGVRLGDRELITKAWVVEDPDEDALARRLLLEKYGPRYEGDLDEWGRTALPVVIDLPVALEAAAGN